MDTLGNIFHVKFLVYSHWFMSIRVSQLNCRYISVDQDRCATSVVAKYLDISRIKNNSKFCKTVLPHDIIFTK